MELNSQNTTVQDDDIIFDDDGISAEADNAGLLLIATACDVFSRNFKSKDIPFSFVDFFIDEISNYSDSFNDYINAFINFYKRNQKLDLYINMYAISGFSIVKGIVTKNGYKYLQLEKNAHFYLDLIIKNPRTKIELESAKQIKQAYEDYKKCDEIKTISELYDNYLIQKFVENFNNIQKTDKKLQLKTKQEGSTIPPESLDQTFIGKKNELPSQKGRVVQVNIPKFNLPLAYPIDLNNSRILSEYHVKNPVRADNMIKFLSKHRISAVGFTVGFVQKRKKLAKKKKIDKFDFDF